MIYDASSKSEIRVINTGMAFLRILCHGDRIKKKGGGETCLMGFWLGSFRKNAYFCHKFYDLPISP